ncbi:MAG: hypothetical protein JRE23_02715 [Deltaproteobacteria bacterium]|nr:hypothetical protein [Deltaproteobacteria bacterium]
MDQAYKNAIVAGISPLEFWELTPYQTHIAMEATSERSDKQAWMIAAFSRAKKLPRFEKLSRGKKKPKNGLLLKRQLEAIKETRKK